jgi:DEAD/DEAH box helicase domain-containing protein
VAVELLLTSLREAFREGRGPRERIRAIAAAICPPSGGEIEAGLRTGEVLGVVSTNALELGIDIGRLDAAILAGYPGTIAATWQQMGRSGRRREASVAILVAGAGAVDQFVATHPEYLFRGVARGGAPRPHESARPARSRAVGCLRAALRFGRLAIGVPTDDSARTSCPRRARPPGRRQPLVLGLENFPASEFPCASARRRTWSSSTPPVTRGRSVIGEIDLFAAPVLCTTTRSICTSRASTT